MASKENLPEKTNILGLFDPIAKLLPNISLNIAHLTGQKSLPAVSATKGIDLSGQQILMFLMGAGQTGKTTFARWIGERSLFYDTGHPPVLLSVDPINRDLETFFGEGKVSAPPPGADAKTWFERVLTALEGTGRSSIVDFGGGDKIVLELAQEIPNLHVSLETSGFAPIAMYHFTPRVTDLDLAAALEMQGFRPKATGLVLNCGRAANPQDFEQLRNHPDYRALIARGAIELWMPRHFAAAEIENRRTTFFSPTGLSHRDTMRNETWMDLMENSFVKPIESWIPR